jgi:hypothetical protein
MKLILQHVQGQLKEANGRHALLLTNALPEAPAGNSLYLCFALVVQGPEDHILPAVVKDDWGNERRGLDVYVWLKEEGHRFPRSEIFGFDPDGTETQCFLRALELYARLPCYAYASKQAAVADGLLLTAVLLPDETATTPQKVKRPSHLPFPLGHSDVSWWLVHPAINTFDFF